jgi:peptidoglycan-N-acetylglucosamine deacetylase
VLLSVSVDVDELSHYRASHGLPEGQRTSVVYLKALPRLADWARQRGLRLTWFLVGRDLETPAHAEVARRLDGAGDELGCHSYSHFYDVTRRPLAAMKHEVQEGIRAIERVASAKVAGFRAPGYVVTDTLLDLLAEANLAYDSSVFPSPAYYAVKLAVIARMAAARRPSRAIMGTPAVLRAPTVPYRVGRPYWDRGAGIWEIPIQVTGSMRLPFIGTALTMAGPAGARLLARGVLDRPLVNLELHAIDALDQHDGLHELAKYQPDLRIPWQKKLDAIDAAIGVLRAKGYASVRMDELAARAARG